MAVPSSWSTANPTWGSLYRRFIAAVVAAGHRAIVVDLLGFGRSDKPERAEVYRLQPSCRRLEDLLEALDLHDATALGQDWPVRLFRARGTGELLVTRMDLFRRFLLLGGPTGIRRDRLTDTVREAYLASHPGTASRTGILQFVRNIPPGPGHPYARFAGEIEQGLKAGFRDKPVRICWGMKDPVFTDEGFLQRLWLETFPDAAATRIPDASHFVQEDAHELVIPALLDLVGRSSPTAARAAAPAAAPASVG